VSCNPASCLPTAIDIGPTLRIPRPFPPPCTLLCRAARRAAGHERENRACRASLRCASISGFVRLMASVADPVPNCYLTRVHWCLSSCKSGSSEEGLLSFLRHAYVPVWILNMAPLLFAALEGRSSPEWRRALAGSK